MSLYGSGATYAMNLIFYQLTKRKRSLKETSTEDSSLSDEDENDSNDIDIYSHKKTYQSHASESSSITSVGSSARVFGIARRPSATSSAHQILSNLDVSQPIIPETVEKFNGSTNHRSDRASTAASHHKQIEFNSVNTHSRTADVARWMGKSSNAEINSNPHHDSTSSTNGNLVKTADTNSNRTNQQPFQGLFEQLKRSSSLDLTACEPPLKR